MPQTWLSNPRDNFLWIVYGVKVVIYCCCGAYKLNSLKRRKFWDWLSGNCRVSGLGSVINGKQSNRTKLTKRK